MEGMTRAALRAPVLGKGQVPAGLFGLLLPCVCLKDPEGSPVPAVAAPTPHWPPQGLPLAPCSALSLPSPLPKSSTETCSWAPGRALALGPSSLGSAPCPAPRSSPCIYPFLCPASFPNQPTPWLWLPTLLSAALAFPKPHL